eukprot:1316823-Ditylum_brightwellii.AAC.1
MSEVLTPVLLKNNINLVLRILIFAGLQHTKMSDVQHQHKTIKWKKYSKLIEQQNGMGWEQIRYGQFGTEWRRAQEKFQEWKKPENSKNKESHWLWQLINVIMTF